MAKVPVIKNVKIIQTLMGGYAAEYPCPYCKVKLKSKEREIGNLDECPHCQGQFIVSEAALERINTLRLKTQQKKQQAQEESDKRKAQKLQQKNELIRQKRELKESKRDVVIVDPSNHAASQTLPSSHESPQVAVQVNVPQQKAPPSNSLGIAALILGILAFLICWIPFVSLLGVPLSGLGLLLATIGLLASLFRGGTGIGYPIAAIAVNGLALFIAFGWIFAVGAALNVATDSVNGGADLDLSDQKNVEPKENRDEENGLLAAEPKKPEDDWADVKDVAQLGDIRVSVDSISVGTVAVQDILGKKTNSQDPLLRVRIIIENVGDTKKIDYQGWAGSDFTFSDHPATLSDNYDNSYKRITFGTGSKITGQIKNDSIYPGKSIADFLVFETPIENAEYLKLELPAKNIGGEGMLRIRIPVESIVGR